MKTLFDIDIETTQTYIRSKKRKNSEFINMVNGLYQTSPNATLEMDGKLASLYAYYFSKMSTRKNNYKRQMFKRLLIHLYKQSCFQLIREKAQVDILFKMSLYGDRFVRNVEGWTREGLNGTSQLESLFKHCFELYPTAQFLRGTFYRTNYTHITWYLDIALGKSVFDLTAFPDMFTKKMAHEFTTITEKCTVERALSIAVIKSYKPSQIMERLILNSALATKDLTKDAFWREIVAFFCKYDILGHYEFFEVMDYLDNVRNHDTDFTLKGRTFNSLKNLSDEWHQQVHMQRRHNRSLVWNPQDIAPFEYVRKENEIEHTYKIKELCSSTELYMEGIDMRHCVAGYDAQCFSGRTAIFTLYEFEEEDTVIEKLVTLEINLTNKAIVQARGKYNATPSKTCIAIIEEWAKEMDYSISKYSY